MSQVRENFTVCDQCGGEIPPEADRLGGVNGTLYLNGESVGFQNLDFCCSEHLAAWVGAQPSVATPNPPYAPPPS